MGTPAPGCNGTVYNILKQGSGAEVVKGAKVTVHATGMVPCGEQGRYGRPARPKRLICRGWPHLGAAPGTLWCWLSPLGATTSLAQPRWPCFSEPGVVQETGKK